MNALRARDLGWAALLAAAAVGAGWYFRAVIVTADPWHYVQSAAAFGSHEWLVSGLTRWGIILPLVPVVGVLGDTVPAYYVFPLLATAVATSMVFLLCRRIASAWIAALTTCSFLALPLVFSNLSRGYPDLMAIGLNGWSLLGLLWLRDRGRFDGRAVLVLLGVGFLSGWAFEVRETTVLTLPVLLWIWWGVARRWWSLLLLLAGLLPWALADIWFSWQQFGDPWAKAAVLLGSDLNDSVSPLDGSYLGHDRLWYLTRLPAAIWGDPWGPVLLGVFVLGLLGAVLLPRLVGVLAAWAVLPAVLVILQAGVLDPAHPSVRVDVPRYWLAYTPGLLISASALCAAVGAGTAQRSWPPRLAGWAGAAGSALLLGVLLVPGVRLATSDPTFRPNDGDALELVAEQLRGVPQVFTDGRTSRILPVYLRSAGVDGVAVVDLTARGGRPQPGSLVLVFSDQQATCPFCQLDLQQWKDAGHLLPPMEQVWSNPSGSARLYRVLEPVSSGSPRPKHGR